jgi:hypothetical protein
VTLSSHLPVTGIIETATALFGSNPSTSKRATNIPRYPANPESNRQEAAMARRLEQLRAAMGESESAPIQEANTGYRHANASARPPARSGSRILTSILSALFGAGMMWLATPQEHTPAPPEPVLNTVAVTTTARTTAAPQTTPLASPELSDEKRIGQLMESWRNAWSQRDVTGYLNAYSQQFSPADGSSHDAWVSARVKKLSAGQPISIQIRNLRIECIDADQFRATFQQDYASGGYRETGRSKTLLIARENGEWRIRQERLD